MNYLPLWKQCNVGMKHMDNDVVGKIVTYHHHRRLQTTAVAVKGKVLGHCCWQLGEGQVDRQKGGKLMATRSL